MSARPSRQTCPWRTRRSGQKVPRYSDFAVLELELDDEFGVDVDDDADDLDEPELESLLESLESLELLLLDSFDSFDPLLSEDELEPLADFVDDRESVM